MEDKYCERCGEKLADATLVELELSTRTGLYTDPTTVQIPPAESQGIFFFGRACAKAVLKAGGVVKTVGQRRAINAPKRRRTK